MVAPEHYRELDEKRGKLPEMSDCEWVEIHGFRGWPEFDKFTVWADEQVKAGVAIEVPVEKFYSGSSIIEQKWLRHVLSGQVWRLVWPDPPFEGVFEPVANEDKRRE